VIAKRSSSMTRRIVAASASTVAGDTSAAPSGSTKACDSLASVKTTGLPIAR
jgi:hypothetical protein